VRRPTDGGFAVLVSKSKKEPRSKEKTWCRSCLGVHRRSGPVTQNPPRACPFAWGKTPFSACRTRARENSRGCNNLHGKEALTISPSKGSCAYFANSVTNALPKEKRKLFNPCSWKNAGVSALRRLPFAPSRISALDVVRRWKDDDFYASDWSNLSLNATRENCTLPLKSSTYPHDVLLSVLHLARGDPPVK